MGVPHGAHRTVLSDLSVLCFTSIEGAPLSTEECYIFSASSLVSLYYLVFKPCRTDFIGRDPLRAQAHMCLQLLYSKFLFWVSGMHFVFPLFWQKSYMPLS